MQTLSRLIIGFFAWLYFLSPQTLRRFTERSIGFIFGKLQWRLKIIEQNIEIARRVNIVGPDFQPETVYRHMAQLILEMFLLFGPMKRFLRNEMEVEGFEHWIEAHKKNLGVIMLGSHMGNWEAMAAKGAEGGMTVLLVTKHLKPEWIHKLMERARARIYMTCTYEPRTFKDVLRHLKKNGDIGFVIDQYAGAPVGVRIPFFGLPVGTQSAIALVVKRTKAVVLPCTNFFDFEKGKRIVRISAPIDWQEHSNPEYEIALNTFRYSQAIEKHIQEHPTEWLWTHRRFKGDLSSLRPGEWTEGRARK